ncbi:MAG: hypothetical protein ACREPT_00065 [Rudaea sp.]
MLGVAPPAIADDGSSDSEPTVTPYRPTVSNPANLPNPGWIEGEFGGLYTFAENDARDASVPWLVKYAIAENYGILVGGNAYVISTPTGASTSRGGGDLSVEWKQAFALSEHSAFGFEAGEIVPTAAHDLGVGKPATVVNGIYSVDAGPVHVDVNAGGTRYTTHSSGVSSWQTAWAGAVSWSVKQNWGAALELSGTQQHGVATQSQLLGAINYNRSAHLVFDFGMAYGLAHAAHDVSVFAGATMLLGRTHQSASAARH